VTLLDYIVADLNKRGPLFWLAVSVLLFWPALT
jgi:hypothetical protein